MERVFIYAFAVSFLMIWLSGRLRRKTGTERGSGLPGLVPPLIVTAVMLLDDRMLPGGIPAPLLAADMLFLDASVLQGIRFMSERRRAYHAPLPVIPCRSTPPSIWSSCRG